jgi:hypothetical protein
LHSSIILWGGHADGDLDIFIAIQWSSKLVFIDVHVNVECILSGDYAADDHVGDR